MNDRRRRFQFDDEAQVDGDDSGAVRFQGASAGVPWAREGQPPWHMWGGSVQVGPINPTFSDSPAGAPVSGQIVKVSYKRPESFHFLFAARILDALVLTDSNQAAIDVYFDVITGIGRSQQVMLGFDHFRWAWDDPGTVTPPFAHVMWSTSALTPALNYTAGFAPDPATRRVVNEIVGQDIQVNCRVQSFLQGSQTIMTPLARVEVSAYLSPKTHVRPDWFADGPLEVQFPGSENQGR